MSSLAKTKLVKLLDGTEVEIRPVSHLKLLAADEGEESMLRLGILRPDVRSEGALAARFCVGLRRGLRAVGQTRARAREGAGNGARELASPTVKEQMEIIGLQARTCTLVRGVAKSARCPKRRAACSRKKSPARDYGSEGCRARLKIKRLRERGGQGFRYL